MAMTVTEAHAVNRVLDHVFATGRDRPNVLELRAAAEVLAAGANRKLMAGVRPEQIGTLPMRVSL